MRKWIALLLAAACLGLAGCEQTQEQAQEDPVVTAYLDAAQQYIDSGDLDTAIAALEEGCEQTGNDPQLTALLEDVKAQKAQQEPEAPPEPEPVVTYEYRYEIIRGDVSWSEANIACQTRGGYLATINSPEEYAEICRIAEEMNSRLPDGKQLVYLWMGANLPQGSSQWKWSTGEEIPLANYYWYKNEPSYQDGSIREDCLCLWDLSHNGYSWTLNDQRNDLVRDFPNISGKIGYVCEYKVEVSP